MNHLKNFIHFINEETDIDPNTNEISNVQTGDKVKTHSYLDKRETKSSDFKIGTVSR